MAKLTRVFQKLFGDGGDQSHFEEFGARAAGSAVFTKDPNTIQAGSAFTGNGWKDAVNPTNNAPFLEDWNGLCLLIFRQFGYLFQEGIPEWDISTTYYIGGIVKKTGTTELYGSLTDNNLGNALPNQTDNGSWHYLNPQSVPPGQVSDFAGASVPFGYLLCDGTSYPQASYPALYAAIGSLWDTFNGASSPGAGNFRVPDLRSLTTIGAGQGTGFSNRTLATLLGEENHVLIVGEMPSHTHVDAGHGHSINVNYDGAGGGGEHVRSWLNTIITGVLSAPILSGSANNQNTGGGGAHNNMQPSAVLNKIIKY